VNESKPTDGDSTSDDPFIIPLAEARRIIRDPSQHFVHIMGASHSICESPDATLDDLLACASTPNRSAAWRPTHLLHERTGVPKRFDESGFIIIDSDFWRGYLSRSADEQSQ
jgi:hypothetical protein